MSESDDFVSWESVEDAALKMFNVWHLGGELEWAEECWKHFQKSGLASDRSALSRTEAQIRLVTLALIYEEFSGYAWDESPESPIDYLAEDLEIDPVALGMLVVRSQPDFFNDVEDINDEVELREMALTTVTNIQRTEIHACLCAAYGGEIELYSRMSRTYPHDAPDGNDGDEYSVTPGNCRALQYVQNGFKS